jgi:DHA2 family multidrug resistance protein-like MFS transporter
LPSTAAATIKEGVFAGLAVARDLGSADLAASVRLAFVAGMDDAFRVAAGIAVASALLALALLPRQSTANAATEAADAASPASRKAVGAELGDEIPVRA